MTPAAQPHALIACLDATILRRITVELEAYGPHNYRANLSVLQRLTENDMKTSYVQLTVQCQKQSVD
jgi:hypothetical protein